MSRAKKGSFFSRVKEYILSVWRELKKVTWPTKKEVINYTLLVLAMTFIVATFIGLADILFNYIFFRLL
ncbi:MAG: preprotein translocase subunit SecE [Tissierellia bacterium]|jgi:preprotein translocase subunit SecE|nr:preprotein translocase subunit SecE [Bacillota bacterium]NLL23397.1 preprotein translocase subunit SecE [Tissierellia bacterium]